MGSFDVQQRTKDGMFNATVLLQQWNDTFKSEKRLRHFLETDNTQEFIFALIEDVNNTKTQNAGTKSYSELLNYQEVPNSRKNGYLDSAENQAVTSESKERNLGLKNIPNSVMVSARGNNGGTWMHPLLFIKFAMWLNPRFELQVLKFVQDKMLEYRNLACESYKELSTNVAKLVPKDLMEPAMRRVARGVNYVVFNTHNPGERNLHATDDEQMKLFNFQNSISFTIKTGLIKTYEQLINFLRDRWMEAWNPFQRDLALKEAKSNLITA